jgi:4-hydroxy-tetrahydrodipicolinate synthase
VVAGTTGEAPTLSERERDALLTFTLDRVGDDMTVVMGTGCADTRKTLALSRRAASLGAHGLLVVTPYYNRGTREGVRTHFLSVAEAIPCPVIAYNVPARTWSDLSLADFSVILSHENVVGVKEAKEDAARFLALCTLFGESKRIYTGSDAFLLPALALGGDGVISVVSGITPRTVTSAIELFREAPQKSRALFAQIAPLTELLFKETSPAPIKEALRQMGYGDGTCRLPLTSPSSGLCEELRAEISRLTRLKIS